MSDDMRALREAEAEIIEEFSFFDDWKDKYAYLIDLGRKLDVLPEHERVDANKVSGCQSQVWMVAAKEGGRMVFCAASDAAIVSGLIALLLRVYSGRLPETILACEPEFIARIGLADHLSPTRSNGLFSMVRKIRAMALEEMASTSK